MAGGGRCDEPDCSLGDDGPAVGARLGATNVAVDEAGNLFIADNQATDYSCDFRVRKVSPNGIINTVAGKTACTGFSIAGDGGPAASAQLSFTPA